MSAKKYPRRFLPPHGVGLPDVVKSTFQKTIERLKFFARFKHRWQIRRNTVQAAEKVYAALVEQARSKRLYNDYQVPDTVDGRFEMVLLHLWLVMARLRHEARAILFCQSLHDVFFQDMDQSLREMGVGDLSVGKKIKVMAQAFHGRFQVYTKAFDAQDDVQLRQALARNIWPEYSQADRCATRLAHYVRGSSKDLNTVHCDDILHGKIRFFKA